MLQNFSFSNMLILHRLPPDRGESSSGPENVSSWDQTELRMNWSTSWTHRKSSSHLISRPLERGSNIPLLVSWDMHEERNYCQTQAPTWLFPGTAQTRAWAPALAHSCLSSLLWPQPGHPAFTQARSGHSVRVSRGQQPPCVQAGTWTLAKCARWCGRLKWSLPFTGQQFICTDIATSLKYK